MRRFLIWSGLAALIGLVLAVVGVWAYGHFYARFQPVTIDRNQAEVERLLQQASWISDSEGGQPAVYVVGARGDASMRDWLREEADKIRASGAQVRVIVFLPGGEGGRPGGTPVDRNTVAQLWLGRDPALLDRWLTTPPGDWKGEGLAQADGSLALTAVATASTRFFDDLSGLLGRAGVRVSRPMVIWRDREGFLKACACSDRRSWAFVRDDLGAPDAVSVSQGVGEPEAEVMDAPSPTAPLKPLPYPNLPAPTVAAPTAPVTPAPAPAQTPAPSGNRPTTSRPAPPTRLERQPPRRQTTPPPRREPTRPKPPEEEDTRFY